MTLPLDHVVILVAELERAIADYTTLGFTVQRGGTHAGGSTHNALVGFADGSYLELIAFLRRTAGAPLRRAGMRATSTSHCCRRRWARWWRARVRPAWPTRGRSTAAARRWTARC
jgi:catechol 2,3-dioxygenase-like lactoylglutathione lyase family enzyme